MRKNNFFFAFLLFFFITNLCGAGEINFHADNNYTAPAVFKVKEINKLPFSSSSSTDLRTKFLYAAIGFTATDSACLLTGIAGIAIYASSLNIIFENGSAAGAMLYSGIGITALFFSLFGIMLPFVIVFWTLYGLQTSSSAKNISAEITDNKICLVVKL